MSAIDVPVWAWVLLGGLLLSFIVIDLIAHRGDGAESRKSALVWTFVWISAALAFNGFVALKFGAEAGEQFLAAYLLEKSLSVDNLFLFIVIFAELRIPRAEQRRVLTFGILGALITRGIFIVLGAAALHRWHEVTYIFGALLVITSLKLLRAPSDGEEPPKAMLWLEKHLPWTRELHGHKFLARVNGRRVATPLLIALITIELTDIVFAIDSIPAAFAVSEDTFIVYSSNVFAVLGLRALYIVLANALQNLRYLRFGLSAVLAFAGTKMLIASWVKFSPLVSVSVIAVCIAIAIVASVAATRRDRRRALGAAA
ncbi:MAG TPA: TerC/Alx family metal homeostasis membrane protein [Kofleriaceae bacterium]